MKINVLLLAFLVALPALAQTTTSTAQTQPAGPLSSQAPGLPASPTAPGLPGFNNQNPILSSSTFPPGQSGLTSTNQFGTNISAAELRPLLLNLQSAIELALPAVAAFNNNFEFVETGTASTNSTATGSPPSPNNGTMPPNSSVPLNRTTGANLSSSLAVNAGQNLSTLAGVATAPAVAGVTNNTTTTVSASSNLSQSLGLFGTNSLTGNSTPNSLRALIVLQSDMERTLQLLAALNGGFGIGTQSGAVSNGFSALGDQFLNQPTNGLVFPTGIRPRSVSPLTPTGR